MKHRSRYRISSRVEEDLQRYRLSDDRPNKETRIERLMREALTTRGLAFRSQGRIGRYRPDFLVDIGGRIVVVECDGPHHRQPRQQAHDRKKDAAYAAAGFPVKRFTDDQIRKSAIGCVEELIREFAP